MLSLKNIIDGARKLMAVAAVAMTVIEDSTDESLTGAQKKAKVVGTLKTQLPLFARSLNVPEFALIVISNEAILGFVVDALVEAANRVGSFEHRGPLAIPSTNDPA